MTLATEMTDAGSNMIVCSECNGNGYLPVHDVACWGNCEKHGCPLQDRCRACAGEGFVRVERATDRVAEGRGPGYPGGF